MARTSARKTVRSPVRQPVRVAAPRLGREQRVDEILATAREIFCRKGFEQTAVSEIAQALGVVEGTVFKYFATKRELLLKVLDRWYDDIIAERAAELIGIELYRDRLHAVICGHLRTVRDYPLFCGLMFRDVRGGEDYHRSGLDAKNRRYTRFLTDVIAEGVAAGEFRAGIVPALMRDLVYGGAEHLTWNYVCGRGKLDIDGIADQLTAIVYNGIEAAPAVVGAANKRIKGKK